MTLDRDHPVFQALRIIHERAGAPSSRTMSQQCGVSHTTINEALNGTRLPLWPTLERMVRTLDGDVKLVRRLYPDRETEPIRRTESPQLALLRDILGELRVIRSTLEGRPGATSSPASPSSPAPE